jgi:outer membrane immunogenic protein
MKMNLLSATAIALAFSAGSAFAADIPSYKAPPPYIPPPPLMTWTGFYAGLNAGYGWGGATNAATATWPLLDAVAVFANNFDPPNVVAGRLFNGAAALTNTGVANVNRNGFIGGGQIGYNYQWGSRFLVGLEADIQGAGIRGSGGYVGGLRDGVQWNDGLPGAPCGPLVNCILNRTALGSGQVTAGVDWMGTVRGRVGYLVTPTMLVYGTGGLAYGGVRAAAAHSATTQFTLSGLNPPFTALNGAYILPTVPGAAHYSNTRVGWTAGGGLEWMFMPNWSLKAEALYFNLGNVTLASSPVAGVSPINFGFPVGVAAGQVLIANNPVTRVRFDGVIARVGISHHFNWGAPPPVVYANY